jgi:hypothetical protein
VRSYTKETAQTSHWKNENKQANKTIPFKKITGRRNSESLNSHQSNTLTGTVFGSQFRGSNCKNREERKGEGTIRSQVINPDRYYPESVHYFRCESDVVIILLKELLPFRDTA